MARILVVDDESLIRALVAEVGSSLGHEVLEAASIKEGFVLARTGVDIVLLDVLLPDGDGLAHVDTFAQFPGRPDVIVITGHGNADAAEAALRSGAWEYLVKPLRPRDLTQALTQAVAVGRHVLQAGPAGTSNPAVCCCTPTSSGTARP